jgi:hypothetical protein
MTGREVLVRQVARIEDTEELFTTEHEIQRDHLERRIRARANEMIERLRALHG